MKKKILLGSLGLLILGFGLIIGNTVINNLKYSESIIISINPQAMLNIDRRGKVTDLIYLNNDALIYNKEEFIDKDYNAAINHMIDVAKEKGYAVDENGVTISTLSDKTRFAENITLTEGNTTIQIRTNKLSKDDIRMIKENMGTEKTKVQITITDEGLVMEKWETIEGQVDEDYEERKEQYEKDFGRDYETGEIIEERDEDYVIYPNGKPVDYIPEKKDENTTTEKDLGGGFVKVEPAGYGDHIKGDHVYLYEGGPRYFKFYETSKIGCKDAIDKKACANWYINDLTPRLASVKGNLETWQNQYDAEVRRLEEAQKKVTELEDEILNYNPEDNYTPLGDLKTSLEHYKTVVEGATSGKKEAQDYVKAINLEIEEYNKVLAVYYAVLN